MDKQLLTLCGMDESVYNLIRLYCTQHACEQETADWFSGIDFEALWPEVSCLAAAMAADRDYRGTPREVTPRLQGIVRYVHTLNLGMTAGLCALGKSFQQAGIPMQLLGHTAIHSGYPKPPTRHMWQAEFAVSEADFPRAAALAEEAGYAVQQTLYSITARQGNTQCVVIRKGMKYSQNPTTVTIGGVSFLLPSSGELILLLTDTCIKTLSGPKADIHLIPWLMDLHCVITAGPDWGEAAAIAEKLGTANQVRLVLELYNTLTPDRLPEGVLEWFGSGAASEKLALRLSKYRSLKPGSVKRLWLHTQISNADSPAKVPWLFAKTAFRVVVQKLISRN